MGEINILQSMKAAKGFYFIKGLKLKTMYYNIINYIHDIIFDHLFMMKNDLEESIERVFIEAEHPECTIIIRKYFGE